MKSILVLGLGKFGRRVVDGLSRRRGVRVFAFDLQKDLVDRIIEKVHTAGSGDLEEPEILEEFLEETGVPDAAVVSLGENINGSILVFLALLERKVGEILIKATGPSHRRVLEALMRAHPGPRVQILIPELDAAEHTARVVASDFVATDIQLGEGFGILEVSCPDALCGKSLREIDFRRRFGLTVVGYREPDARSGKPTALKVPTPDTVLPKGSLVMLVGNEENLRALEREFGGGVREVS